MALYPSGPQVHLATTSRTSPGLSLAHRKGDLIYLNSRSGKQEGSGKRRPIVCMGTLRLGGAVTQPCLKPGMPGVEQGAGRRRPCWEGDPRVLPPAQSQALRQRVSLLRLQGSTPTGAVVRGGQNLGPARDSPDCVPLPGKKPLPRTGVARGATMEAQPGVLRAELREAVAAGLRLGVCRS